jgi:anti-sigma regulatory factor (Ser/Thr protein kinase)
MPGSSSLASHDRRRYAVEAGMTENRAQDVMLAAHELAANAVRHGAGAGRLQMRTGDGMLRVQVHDAGPASRTGQAGTAGLDEQDIPGGGDGGWPLRPVMGCGWCGRSPTK